MTTRAARIRHLIPAIALTILCPAVAQATSFVWNSSGGRFVASLNWTQSRLPIDANGTPDSDDTATFNRGNVSLYTVYFCNLCVPTSDIHPTIDRLVIGNNSASLACLYGSTLTVDSGNTTETARSGVIGSRRPGACQLLRLPRGGCFKSIDT